MYKSKGEAWARVTRDSTHKEFFKMYDVIKDIIILPEFIESRFSDGLVDRRSLGKLRAVRPLKKPHTRPGTPYTTRHKIDMAALLPMAAAFKECLQLKGDRYSWRVDPFKVFEKCAESL